MRKIILALALTVAAPAALAEEPSAAERRSAIVMAAAILCPEGTISDAFSNEAAIRFADYLGLDLESDEAAEVAATYALTIDRGNTEHGVSRSSFCKVSAVYFGD